MTKARWILTVVAVIFFLFNVLILNFKDLSWTENSSSYIGMLSMFFVVGTMIASNKHEKKRQ